jgi:Sulfotransferase family
MTTPKTLYIAGSGRSGSTLLERVLGQVDGWLSCGELNLVWHNLSCGCGAAVFDCQFWKPVLRESLERHPGLDPGALIRLRRASLGPGPATLPAIARAGRRSVDGDRPLRRYADLLTDLYALAASAVDARVIVDSSKTASDAYLIAALTDIDLYVVHLVRDPRAVAYSWGRKRARTWQPLAYFRRISPTKSSLNWLRRNAVIEALLRRRLGARYLRVRYEDFADQPQRTAQAICSLVGEPNAELPFSGERLVQLHPNHTVGGNPVRFATGELQIRLDDEWQRRMGFRSRLAATLAAAPLIRHYGYALRSGRMR